jgi:hypothetical protein
VLIFDLESKQLISNVSMDTTYNRTAGGTTVADQQKYQLDRKYNFLHQPE